MKHKRTGMILIAVGLCLIICAGFLVHINFNDSDRAAQLVQDTMAELNTIVPERIIPAKQFSSVTLDHTETLELEDVPFYLVNPEIEMLEQDINGISYIGILEIPSLNLELPIASQWSEKNAKIAPCRYSGSVYLGDMILCAHNYASHFGRLSELTQGEQVLFTDFEGNQFEFQVQEFEVMDGKAIDQMKSGEWELTLFTCTVGGRSRIAVRCMEVK